MSVTIENHPEKSGFYRLNTEFWVPRPRAEVFQFFGDARNLEAITPPWLNFQVVTPQPINMRPGTLIDYRLKLHGIPLGWRTEISVWEPPFQFVDRQLKGPYRLWHHLHTFEERDGGTLCRDVVDYGFLGGPLIHFLLVKRDLLSIFRYREAQLLRRFGEPSVSPSAGREVILST